MPLTLKASAPSWTNCVARPRHLLPRWARRKMPRTSTTFVEARYAHQVWEIDVEIKTAELEGSNAAQALRAAFHDAHERIFAFRDENSMVEAIAWRAQVRCKVADTTELRIASEAAGETADRHRQAYFAGIGCGQVSPRL